LQESEVAPVIADYWEKAEFPFELVAGLGKLNVGGANIKGYGCAGMGVVANAMACMEMARVDASVSTFYLVHNFLALLTIGLLVGALRQWDSRAQLRPAP
jgi:acyl-CoA oxidase